jgi:hypothetical protein
LTDSADALRGANYAPAPRRAHKYLAGVLTGYLAVGLSVGTRGGYLNALAAMGGVGACGCALLWWFAFDAELRARALGVLRDLASSGARVRFRTARSEVRSGSPRQRVCACAS